MAGTSLAFALAGLGGFNAHGAGFLQAARDNEIEPYLVTATSGQIVVLAAYLKGAKDLKKGLIDKALEDNPLAQLRIALLGYPGVFEPAVTEAVARILAPPYLGIGIDFFANRFLPAQLYKPARTAETIKELADTFNDSHIGVLFNAYTPRTGEGVLFGNDAARERMKTETSISILSDQKSRDPRIAKPGGKEQAILAITPTAIKSALWLSLYGFADTPNRQIDGAYHRSCIVSELHNFDRVIVCRPLANAKIPAACRAPGRGGHCARSFARHCAHTAQRRPAPRRQPPSAFAAPPPPRYAENRPLRPSPEAPPAPIYRRSSDPRTVMVEVSQLHLSRQVR